MRRIREAALVALVMAVLAILGHKAAVWVDELPPLAGEWKETLKSSVASPDGMYVAEVYEGAGGATAGDLTSVRLRENSRETASHRRNKERECVAFSIRGHPGVVVLWKNPKHLVVKCPVYHASNVRVKVRWWKDLAITYSQVKTE